MFRQHSGVLINGRNFFVETLIKCTLIHTLSLHELSEARVATAAYVEIGSPRDQRH